MRDDRDDSNERYDRPTIVRRDRIEALLQDVTKSEVKPDGQTSDVNLKANIVPVAWGDETVAYAAPAIVDRTAIAGLLDSVKSEPQPDGGISDVNLKANIVPVAWDGETVAYTTPAIVDRTAIAGLLDSVKSEPQPDGESDVNVKANIVPVRW